MTFRPLHPARVTLVPSCATAAKSGAGSPSFNFSSISLAIANSPSNLASENVFGNLKSRPHVFYELVPLAGDRIDVPLWLGPPRRLFDPKEAAFVNRQFKVVAKAEGVL